MKMASLYWNYKELTDSGLSEKLNGLPQGERVIQIDISHNKLETVPELCRYKQFDCVELIFLNNNNIMTLEADKIPLQTKMLYLYGNKISELGDLSRHHRLEELGLNGNRIKYLDPSKLPPNIRQLYVSDNEILDVGDLSQHKQLVKLNLRENEISRIHSANTDLSFWQITNFRRDFFETDGHYKRWLKYNFDKEPLKQPSPSNPCGRMHGLEDLKYTKMSQRKCASRIQYVCIL